MGVQLLESRLAQRPAEQPPAERLSDHTIRRLAAVTLAGLTAPLVIAASVLSGAGAADASMTVESGSGVTVTTVQEVATTAIEAVPATSTTDLLSGSPITGSPIESTEPADSPLVGSGVREGGLDDPSVARMVAAALTGASPATDRISNSRTKGS